MEQNRVGQSAVLVDEALRRANELDDENLQAALRLSKDSLDDASLLLPVVQLPQDGAAALLPSEQRAERKFMCPELYRAAFSGSIDELEDLLAAPNGTTTVHDQRGRRHSGKCSLDEVTAGWNTVLHIAAEQGHLDLVTSQLSHDGAALVPRVNSKSETALHRAARAGHHRMVSLLIRLAQEQGPGAPRVLVRKKSGGETALHVAARHGREAVVEVLMVAAPALSCAVNDAGISPLYHAVVSRSVGTVRALVRSRCSQASASGPNGQNALHAAVLHSAEITQELLSWNSNLARETDESESTPLHYAASDGDREIISMFIRSAPSALYLQDKEGFTPLHIAAWMGHDGLIHDILEACPDSAELVDNKARNFLHVAVERGHESAVRYIVGRPFLAELVIEQDSDGNTPVHSAVIAANPNLAVLDSGVLEFSIANNQGKTPFDLALETTSFLFMTSCVLKLCARGAPFGTRRQDGVAPWKSKMMKEWQEKTSRNLAIVAVLVSTIALTAMFNVPGGYDANGVANLRSTVPYNAFVMLDTVAVASSLIATMLLTYGMGTVPSSAVWICLALIFLWIALLGMILAFMAAVVSGLDNSTTKGVLWGISALPFAFLVGLSFVWAVPAPTFTSVHLLFRAFVRQDRTRMRRHVGRRFPLVGFYLLVLYFFWFLNAVAFGLTVYVVVNTIT